VAGGEAQPAGSNAAPFLRSWLPIAANGSGDNLFVDLRPGPRTGLVAEFEHENGGFNQPALWPDIAAMLEDVASALRTGRWVHPNVPDYDLVPVVDNRKLRWESGPSPQKKLSEPPPRPKTREYLRAHVALLDGTWSDKDIMARLASPPLNWPKCEPRTNGFSRSSDAPRSSVSGKKSRRRRRGTAQRRAEKRSARTPEHYVRDAASALCRRGGRGEAGVHAFV
jgi:hypothetical protein